MPAILVIVCLPLMAWADENIQQPFDFSAGQFPKSASVDEDQDGEGGLPQDGSDDDLGGDPDEDLDEDLLDDELALLAEEDVVELAARHRQDIGMSPSAITVINREDIATSGATTVPDLLRLVPGMEVVVVSPFAISINSRLHWTYENNTYLVLIDGRETNLDLMGQPPWSLQAISMDDIERIEVIRGPGSALYGANAFGGVVSIVTRAVSEKHGAWARVEGGEVGFLRADGRASFRMGPLGLSLSGGYGTANSHSLPDVRSLEVWRARGVLEYELSSKRKLALDVSLGQGDGDIPSGAGLLSGRYSSHRISFSFEGEDARAHLFWNYAPTRAGLARPIEYKASPGADPIPVASFRMADVELHSIDAELQYDLPTFYDPLLIIIGAAARANGAISAEFLDAKTYLDDESPLYLKPGIEHWGYRAGAFIHGEYAPVDWLTTTAGVRYDFSTETGHAVSPRLAMVFRPGETQFIRLGAARAFRKPSFMETRLHPMVVFPNDSILSAASQEAMQNMMTRVVGNEELENETMWSFEAGYLGRFLDGQLTASCDLYYSQLRNMIEMKSNFVEDPLSFVIDFEGSSFQFEHVGQALDIVGLELALRYSPSEHLSFLFSWAHREIYDLDGGKWLVQHPRNQLTLGGRFRTEFGLLGSLYLFARSEFGDYSVDSPHGILDGYFSQHQPHYMLALARLGYRYRIMDLVEAEVGVRLFLPISPFQSPHFRSAERGGGVSDEGVAYGGDVLRRVVSVYLEGSF